MSPVQGLDIPTKERFLQTLEKLAKTKTQLIYVTHHIDEILPLTTHVLFLKNGTIFSKGTKSKMLTGLQSIGGFRLPYRIEKNVRPLLDYRKSTK